MYYFRCYLQAWVESKEEEGDIKHWYEDLAKFMSRFMSSKIQTQDAPGQQPRDRRTATGNGIQFQSAWNIWPMTGVINDIMRWLDRSLRHALQILYIYIYIYGQWHVNWKLHVVETWGCFVIFSFLWHTKFRITGTILLRSSNQSSDQLLTHTQPQEFLHPLMWTCRQKGSAFLRVWRGEWFFKTEAFKWRMLQVF